MKSITYLMNAPVFLKYAIAGFLIGGMMVSCGKTQKVASNSKEGKSQQDPVENKKRAEAPAIAAVSTYKIFPDDTVGTILDTENYNEKGLKTAFLSYDYYGSGELEETTTYEYDDKGRLIKHTDGTTHNTFTYDDDGKQKTEAWSRANGQGASEENYYDEKGNEIETKYFTADGTYDFSRVTEYTYDNSGNIIEEKKWEKYTDGSADLQMYYISQEFDEKGQLIKKNSHRESGDIYDTEVYIYDPAGNLEMTDEYENGELMTRGINEYNEYGELIKDQMFNVSGDRRILQYTNTYRYDKYGNQVYMMYVHEDGESWGERVVYTYR